MSAFVFLWLYRLIPDALNIGAGAAANAAAITANGGVVPVSPSVWETAKLPVAPPGELENSDLTTDASLGGAVGHTA